MIAQKPHPSFLEVYNPWSMKAKAITLLLSLLLCFIVYPSSFIYSKDTLPDNNDTRLITYIINQVQINLTTSNSLFYGTFFAPEKDTLTYSDLFFTSSLLTLPSRLVTDHPVFIFNLAWIINFTLTIFTSYYFFKDLGANIFSATLAAIVFNLSGIHLHYYPHLQIFSFWLIFSSLITLSKYLKTNKSIYLYLFLSLFSLQLFESIFAAYLLFFISVILYGDKIHKHTYKLHPSSLLFPLTWSAYLWKYYQTHLNFPEAERSIRDAAHNSLSLTSYFTHHQAAISLILLLVLGSVIYHHQKNNWLVKNSLNLFLFSTIMSLGPVLKFGEQTLKPLTSLGLNWPIPLPYTLFYYLFPGFQSFRTPSRFATLTLLSLCIILAIGLSRTTIKSKTKIIFIFLALSILSTESRLPLSGYPVNLNLPMVYETLAGLPKDSIILELPVKLWNMPDHQIESIRSLYSLKHGLRRFGGYSGFASHEWIKLVEEINSQGLTIQIKQKLKTREVTHIIQNNTISKI